MVEYGKTETFDEALGLFAKSPVMEKSITVARVIADELIHLNGSTDTKAVKAVMLARGLLDPAAKHHWMGSIFHKRSKYKKTGEVIQANGHDAIVNRWMFRDHKEVM